jgi:FlaA1/EpsC-like NDP-sugar epimerase
MDHADRPQIDAAACDLLPASASSPGRRLSHERLAGRRVLITGAGGSIGSALAHSVQASDPAGMILFDSSENGLYQIDRALAEVGCDRHVSILGSVCDTHRLERLFAEHGPQVVFHSAACKHVPLMESNPCAAILNNALGTLHLRRLAVAFHAEALVLVSTDKAADPVSIMGASKRVAELLLLAGGLSPSTTRMLVVRLVNVAGSQGSVLPLFLDQIARGVPLTVTHREAERYFMTMDDAVQALLSALEVHANPALLIPEVGPPVRILDLATRLLARQQSPAQVVFTGLRPGEKLRETLLGAHERWAGEPVHPALRAVKAVCSSVTILDGTAFDAKVEQLGDAAQRGDIVRMLLILREIVPEYRPDTRLAASLEALA